MTSSTRPSHARPGGFTMIELLVVIGIIVLLAAILVPVVSQVRMQGYKATTTGEMQRIMQACLNYYHDFNSYPGPLSNSQVAQPSGPAPGAPPVNMQLASTVPPNSVVLTPTAITSSENLVLGLLGLLTPGNAQTDPNSYYAPPPPQHDVESLNYLHPATYHYIDYIPEELTPGYAFANFGENGSSGVQFTYPTDSDPKNPTSNQRLAESIFDSQIPKFQDHIPDPMPILYLKAYTGVTVGPPSGVTGVLSTATLSSTPGTAQFNFQQLSPYGFNNVSQADFNPKSVYPNLTISGSTADQTAVCYFLNPNIAGQPRGKDSFILISAGPDRMYGTADDIIVAP